MFTIYGALHPKSDKDRLYIPRKEEGRGLISIEDCVELAIRGLEVHVHGSEKRLIQAARGDKIDNCKESCNIIDFAVPGDSSIEEKKKDKKEKYQDLGRELQKIWNVKVKIIPLVVGSLGATPKQFGNRLKQIGIIVGTAQVQKIVLLGTSRILRKVLEIEGCWLWLDFNGNFQYSFTVC